VASCGSDGCRSVVTRAPRGCCGRAGGSIGRYRRSAGVVGSERDECELPWTTWFGSSSRVRFPVGGLWFRNVDAGGGRSRWLVRVRRTPAAASSGRHDGHHGRRRVDLRGRRAGTRSGRIRLLQRYAADRKADVDMSYLGAEPLLGVAAAVAHRIRRSVAVEGRLRARQPPRSGDHCDVQRPVRPVPPGRGRRRGPRRDVRRVLLHRVDGRCRPTRAVAAADRDQGVGKQTCDQEVPAARTPPRRSRRAAARPSYLGVRSHRRRSQPRVRLQGVSMCRARRRHPSSG
jgi:hypothetical protein